MVELAWTVIITTGGFSRWQMVDFWIEDGLVKNFILRIEGVVAWQGFSCTTEV